MKFYLCLLNPAFEPVLKYASVDLVKTKDPKVFKKNGSIPKKLEGVKVFKSFSTRTFDDPTCWCLQTLRLLLSVLPVCNLVAFFHHHSLLVFLIFFNVETVLENPPN